MKTTEQPQLAAWVKPETDALCLEAAGHVYRIPWSMCSHRLATATHAQRAQMELSPGGYGIHWPQLDEDLAVHGLVNRASPPVA